MFIVTKRTAVAYFHFLITPETAAGAFLIFFFFFFIPFYLIILATLPLLKYNRIAFYTLKYFAHTDSIQ